MKKLLITIMVMAFVGAGCSSEAKKEANHGHPHAGEAAHDESVPHEHADTKEEAAPTQEEFTLSGSDTTTIKKSTEKHSHDGKTEHEH